MNSSSQNADMTNGYDLNRDGDLIVMYLDHLRLNRASRHTTRTYGSHLRGAHAAIRAGLPRAYDQEILHWAASARTVATQRDRVKVVRLFFAWAVRHGHIDHDPTGTVPQPPPERRLPEVPTDAQVARVLVESPADVRLWSTLAAYGGMRREEIAVLHREDVARDIRIHGKGRKDRLMPTHPLVAAAVETLRPGRITSLTPEQLGNRARRIYHQLGVPISIHRLRAWCATSMLRAGVDLATVQDLLGHVDPKTTRRYATPSAAQFTTAVASLPDLAPTAAAAGAARG